MLSFVRQNLWKHLAALSVAAGFGVTDVADELQQIPAELVADLAADTELETWNSDERGRVLTLLAQDPRPSVRGAVAHAVADLEGAPTWESSSLLRRLAADRSDEVQRAAASALSRALGRAPVAVRLQAVCEWALSPDATDRVAVARALTRSVPILATDTVLAHLARDPVARVRHAALQATATRLWYNSAAVADIAAFALNDQDPRVRRLARGLFGRTDRDKGATHA
jgi:HEAT repeat protein